MPGQFCDDTLRALQQFQGARGLRTSAVCDEDCWKALVEASWSLGDRLLVLTSPNLRGDDVAELQGSLARLGFDCGRVDGIFGPRSARALEDFQSNCGLPADGVCGTQTVRVLSRVIGQTGDGPGIAIVRERERLRHSPATLSSLRVVVGQFGGLSTITRAVCHQLRATGAFVITLDEPDPIIQARVANHFAAHAYLGFEASTGDTSVVHYYRVPTFESLGGRTMATCLTTELAACRGLMIAEPAGMRLPVLRETRMPAVLCSLAPVRMAVDASPEISTAVFRALQRWTTECSLTG